MMMTMMIVVMMGGDEVREQSEEALEGVVCSVESGPVEAASREEGPVTRHRSLTRPTGAHDADAPPAAAATAATTTTTIAAAAADDDAGAVRWCY
ncbi:hypothetical protein AXG93_2139s1270 [Marchantia polymorpha subsp. ruderalis]|uniref:Uncharacterized protein n=1 Tax=Marchantia polymorpha subsp. ruderalis TaxID=1480154 RepID=A0A176WL35_MARPO|nr:hypothetical protein AXG93_2139s1270 [Marchantia polymorpha subsp. ruderalis]